MSWLDGLLATVGKRKPMDKRSRLWAAFLALLGLWTFFTPTITTVPPVLGHSRWSPFDILALIGNGALPTHPGAYSGVPLDGFHFVLGYFFLLLALLFVTFLPSTKGLFVAAVMNTLMGGTLNRYGTRYLWSLFYDWRAPRVGQVYFGEHLLLLLAIDLLLVGLALSSGSAEKDDEPPPLYLPECDMNLDSESTEPQSTESSES